MSTSRVPALVDGLVAVFTSGVGSQAPVYDGPPLGGADSQMVIVGDNADPTADDDVAVTTQAWAGLGARQKDETGTVQCVVVARSGDVEFKPLRDSAFALFALCESALRSDPTVGGVLPQPGWSEIADVTLRQSQAAEGAIVRVLFTVQFRTRI